MCRLEKFALACVIGSVISVSGAPASAADNAEAICRAAINAFETATASGDAAKVAATYAPDGQFVGEDGVITGQEALGKSPLPPGAKDVDTLSSSRTVGDVVLCSGGYTYTFTGGPTGGIKGFWTKVVGKVGSDWKILVLTANTTPTK